MSQLMGTYQVIQKVFFPYPPQNCGQRRFYLKNMDTTKFAQNFKKQSCSLTFRKPQLM